MSTTDPAVAVHPPARKPVVTWVLLLAGLGIILLLPERAGSGSTRPLWIFTLPVLLGWAGAVFALRAGHYWWFLLSAVWGAGLIQALVLVTTLIGGP